MACPFFAPLEPWSDTGETWPGPRRVPLGEPYRGHCSATTDEIDLQHQAELCNFGYARNRCGHFPNSAEADAIRFSIPGVNGGHIQLIWIAERDHAPVSHGAVESLPPQFVKLADAFRLSYRKGKCPQGITSL